MKVQTSRFLRLSLIAVLLLCLIVFSFLAFYMNQKNTKTINEVGTIYMSSISEQVSIHFETIISMRLFQVKALAESVSLEYSGNVSELRRLLEYNANTRDFSYLALCSPSGEFEMIYGKQVQITDPGPYLASLNAGEDKVAVGSDADGNTIILLGTPAHYPMANGQDSAALVAAFPSSTLNDSLSLDENDDRMYSFIIRQDSSFVIRNSDAYRQNYFDRVRALYTEINGPDSEKLSTEEFIADLSASMLAQEDYSAEFTHEGERWHLYCTDLAYSEWYLLTFMPYETLDSMINELSSQWIYMVLIGCATILAALLLVFTRYFQLTRQQIRELEKARQTAEEAQQAAEDASRAKSEFLSNMSHDIRTPMNAVVGMTAIATANIDNKEQVQNCLKKIALSSKHLLGLINDVLDMSKIESGKMTLNLDQVSLREVVDSIVNIVQPQVKAKSQQFDVFIHDISVENVCCDGVRLNQILLNLLSNAIKFTPEGGQIHVAMCQEESPKGEDLIRTRFQVKDTGIGMSPDFMAKIFDSFTREDRSRVHKTEGTGLGMAITKYIVDAMDGKIEVDSEQGKGSEFSVTLDLQKALIQEMDMILPSWNMLVVDDDQRLCESTVDSLKAIGINADWTLDGEHALKMVEQRHKRHDDYHIILLDWKLPGMDGLQTAREIRRLREEDIPILLISAYDWSEIEDEAREAGIVGFISKPLFKSTLFYGLRSFMGSSDKLAKAGPDDELDLTGRRVLLAEDNELNWEIASELLSELGLELDWAENGQICVDKFTHSEPGYYDAVLMDLRMPVMNGYEATQAIRTSGRADADLPIIAMTADAFAEDIQKCLDAGMNAHVAKPIDVRDVSRLLEKFCK